MRNEYPRMDSKREKYQLLNGEWDFAFDESNIGLTEKWFMNFPIQNLVINVPFAYQTELSGINKKDKIDTIWYRKKITLDKGFIQLNFGAVDFEADIYIDGQHVCNHIGGETAFSINYNVLEEKEYEIVVRAFDPSYDEEIPRGKQFWENESRGIWYTPTSGIWQPVWVDYIGEVSIENIKTNSRLIDGMQDFEIEVTENAIGHKLRMTILDKDLEVSIEKDIRTKYTNFTVDLYENMIFKIPFHSGGKESICWSPENPRLFDYKLEIIKDNQVEDRLDSYFGFREITIEDGITYLNNNPYYFKLVLDQGYWEQGLLTAPSDSDFKKDIELAKEMGFNGCRKHQKVEDPRFLYWADKLGFLVWGEVSSAPVFTDKAVKYSQNNWFDIIKRDYNHPSIVAWVPLNESWGVPFIKNDEKQQAHSMSLYYQIKSIDNTRLVVNNDGWEMTKSDICAIHNYNHGHKDDDKVKEYFKHIMSSKDALLNSKAAGKPIYANGYSHDEQTPIMITEFGGIAYDSENPNGWGYTAVTNAADLVSEYQRIIEVFANSTAIFGYCYTQLCDVEQEVNGFLKYNREPKCDLSLIKEINDNLFIKY